MRISVCISFLLLYLLLSLPGSAAQLSTGKFANVFVEDESVVINVSAPGQVTLADHTGNTVLTKAANGKADFGKLVPGYYEVASEDTRLPIVVVISPEKRVKGDSAAAVDNAMSWLVPQDDFENMARMLKLAGMTWVRERLSWGESAKPGSSFDFGKYVLSAKALSEQGIKVYQIFHDSPAWARKDRVVQAVPDDLRNAYNFGKAFAKEFKGKVYAWEFWNEPDIAFFFHTSSECAALQKAAYLGAKSVDPSLRLLGPSMATTGAFESNLLANDAGWYMDVWNYHIYAATEAYQARADHFMKVMAANGVRLPMWTTEAGDPFVDGADGVLSGDKLKHQARFASRAFPQGIAAGVERFYYFVFPFYHEGSRGWGVFGPGNKYPYPGLAAISNATYSLGQAKYVGTVDTGKDNRRIMVFDRGDGTSCVAVWQNSENASVVDVPLNWEKVLDARDYLGTPIARSTGNIKIEIADGVVFFVVKSTDLKVKYIKAKALPKLAKRSKPDLMQIVPRIVYPKPVTYLGQIKTSDAYMVDPNLPVPLNAEVYNFSNKALEGEIIFKAVANCTVGTKPAKCRIGPGGRFQVPFSVNITSKRDKASVMMYVVADGKKSSVAMTNLAPDLDLVPPLEGKAIKSAKPEDWEVNIVPGAKLDISADPDSGVRFVSTFPPNVDKWTYPQTVKDLTMDLSGYDALQFEYKTSPDSKGVVRAMSVEENGAYYIMSTLPCSEQWRLATVLFKDSWQFETKDEKLDMDKVVQIRIGANSETPVFTLSVRNVKAVKL